jgi:hypothetical protein
VVGGGRESLANGTFRSQLDGHALFERSDGSVPWSDYFNRWQHALAAPHAATCRHSIAEHEVVRYADLEGGGLGASCA